MAMPPYIELHTKNCIFCHQKAEMWTGRINIFQKYGVE